MSTPFYVVFDGMPGPHPNDCCFVEVESEDGRGFDSDVTGGWSDHAHDGNLARLGPFVKATPLTLSAPALLEALKDALRFVPLGAGALALAAIAQAEGE